MKDRKIRLFFSVFVVFMFIAFASATDANLEKIEINTCSGEGDLFLYEEVSEGPYNNTINTSFVASEDEVLIFVKPDAVLEVKVEGINATITEVVSETAPFEVKVYSVSVNPGDEIEISGVHEDNSKAIQGYLVQDSDEPVYDFDTLSAAHSEVVSFTDNLLEGTYDYVFFDKYTLKNDGKHGDSRRVEIIVTDFDSNEIFNEVFHYPFPEGIEGAVIVSFVVENQGEYVFDIETKDSVYWFESFCSEPPPECVEGYELIDGECVPEPPTECEDDEILINDQCIELIGSGGSSYEFDNSMSPAQKCALTGICEDNFRFPIFIAEVQELEGEGKVKVGFPWLKVLLILLFLLLIIILIILLTR
tara:strand:- start:1240 stop:2325 length:1086 start_codon:yes stop_codon:yes gene_type:complete